MMTSHSIPIRRGRATWRIMILVMAERLSVPRCAAVSRSPQRLNYLRWRGALPKPPKMISCRTVAIESLSSNQVVRPGAPANFGGGRKHCTTEPHAFPPPIHTPPGLALLTYRHVKKDNENKHTDTPLLHASYRQRRGPSMPSRAGYATDQTASPTRLDYLLPALER